MTLDQILNIQSIIDKRARRSDTREFLDVLIKLTKKPDDKESLEKIVEYAKSLGI